MVCFFRRVLVIDSHFSTSAIRVYDALATFVRTGAPTATFINSAMPVIPLIKAAAVKIAAFTNLNRTVHSETYNRLIGEAVAKLVVGDE
jgi:hypothetical protein